MEGKGCLLGFLGAEERAGGKVSDVSFVFNPVYKISEIFWWDWIR